MKPLYVASATLGVCSALVFTGLARPSAQANVGEEEFAKRGGYLSAAEKRHVDSLLDTPRIEQLSREDESLILSMVKRNNLSSGGAVLVLLRVRGHDQRIRLIDGLRSYCDTHADATLLKVILGEWWQTGDSALVAGLVRDKSKNLAKIADDVVTEAKQRQPASKSTDEVATQKSKDGATR